MRRIAFLLFAGLFVLGVMPSVIFAQDVMVPAGTLLRCTMDEPNLSSATAQIGDPVLCHLNGIQEFGRAAFPRGSYLSGRLEEAKEPGHFWGKGYMRIVFDRIGLPNTDVPIGTKVIAARGYKVDKDGDIRGKGHAKRDVIEWMIPPLWPWKVLMLPARGPRPTLKGEQTLTLRLMEDVVVPRAVASYNPNRPPNSFGNFREQSYNLRPSVTPSVDVIRPVRRSVKYAEPVAPAMDTPAPAPIVVANDTQVETPAVAPKLTLIAFKNETIYAVTRYWVEGEHLSYALPSGTSGQCSLEELDLARMMQLNSERGVPVVLQSGTRPGSAAGNSQ